MSSTAVQAPPDQTARLTSLDPSSSILVQAPAGSGKTDLLTRRFLRLLAEADDPGQIVAITFTKAAAAEMRHRILSELEKAAAQETTTEPFDEFSMEVLAQRALDHSRALNWKLLDLTAQLRISTIDSFCRDLAVQQPLLSGIGGNLQINEQPSELYRRAARRALENLGNPGYPDLSGSIESLLLRRDNAWQEMETLLVGMLHQRDRWMLDFVLDREQDWKALRDRLERPFRNAVEAHLTSLDNQLDRVAWAREEAMELARLACEEPGEKSPLALAETPCIPRAPFGNGLQDAMETLNNLAAFLQTKSGSWRTEKGLKTAQGFPPTARGQEGKSRFATLVARLSTEPELESALCALRSLPPARYSDEEWQIVRACFTLLRRSVAELKTIFAETGTVDFIEVAQIAQQMLRGADGLPTDSAIAVADGIHHILLDEFQDTSRRQHQLLCSLVAAWPDHSGRTVFMVGDPMQSIYFFRDADAELFPRVRKQGLDISGSDPFSLNPIDLKANFRTEPALVDQLNSFFSRVFAISDGSGVTFSATEPAREPVADLDPRLELHLRFVPQPIRSQSSDAAAKRAKQDATNERESAHSAQTAEIVDLIRSYQGNMDDARAKNRKFRIAVLGRTRNVLAPIAFALRDANTPFRALDLERLKDRPEILDALSLARALLNPEDRAAWLAVLRAPWCGLSLQELHTIAGDDAGGTTAPIPILLAHRLDQLSDDSRRAVERLWKAFELLPAFRRNLPAASLGTLLERLWMNIGGEACVDATARANLDLLWKLLDGLPEGEQDLLGPALGNALESLCALPDPLASEDCGVQLMTIHKSKGLEFEVVIVPDLQAHAQAGERKLLSWLERGLVEAEEANDPTEFLVAPVQPKGADRGLTKTWVDRMYRERETQEMRRILYVAATRAREELHLFARPEYKILRDGSRVLTEPSNSLLATAWPALREEVQARFAAWQATNSASQQQHELVVPAIAASGSDNLVVMPTQQKPTLLRRLPPDLQAASSAEPSNRAEQQEHVGVGFPDSYERHQGGSISRALGNAVHKLLEKLAHFRSTRDWRASLDALAPVLPAITARIRAAGVPASQAASIAQRAYEYVHRATQDPYGQWILSPHNEAASEAGWAGSVDGDLRLVRVDRIFRAGLEPLQEGTDAWWIIDFKTAHADDVYPLVALPEFRAAFAPQLEMYAAVLRNLHGPDATVRAALYYPRMSLLDWWEI